MSKRRYEPGDRPIPSYTLEKWLGQGGFGEVWQAKGPGVDVAVKIVHDVRRNVGGKELRALRTLRTAGTHANLISLHGYWCLDRSGKEIPLDSVELRNTISETVAMVPSTLIVVMDLAESNLLDLLHDRHPDGIPVQNLLVYMRDAARGIDFLNIDHGIQHCDIKPANIFLKSGSALIGDFGLAKLVDEIRETAAAESPGYSPPEIANREGPSASSDQYSLAISYVELRTGELPYLERTFEAVHLAKATGNLHLDALPAAEREVVRRATSVKPEERYETCNDFVSQLDDAVRGPRGTQVPSVIPAEPPRPPSIKGTLVADMLGADITKTDPGQVAATTPLTDTTQRATDSNPPPPSWASSSTSPPSGTSTDTVSQTQPAGNRSVVPALLGVATVLLLLLLSGVGYMLYEDRVLKPRQRDEIRALQDAARYAQAVEKLEQYGDPYFQRDRVKDEWYESIADRISASADDNQAVRPEVEEFKSWFAKDGAKLEQLLERNAAAIRLQLPTELARALKNIRTETLESQTIANNWIELGEDAANGQPRALQQVWQLKLVGAWAGSMLPNADWPALFTEMEELRSEGETAGYLPGEQDSLVAVLGVIASAKTLKRDDFQSDVEFLDALQTTIAATDNSSTSEWFIQSGSWAPSDVERGKLTAARESLRQQMSSQLAGNFEPLDTYAPYYDFLVDQFGSQPALALGRARMNSLSGDFAGAERLLASIPNPSAEVVDELGLLRLLNKSQLPEFEKAIDASGAPDSIRDRLRQQAVEAALAKIDAEPEGFRSASVRDLIVTAGRLNNRLPSDVRPQFKSRIEKLQTEIVDDLRVDIIQRAGENGDIDFATLLQDCQLARIEQSGQLVLRYIQIECELETGAPPSSLPADELNDAYRNYGTYIRSRIEPGNVESASIDELAGAATTDPMLAAPHRRSNIGRMLAESLGEYSLATGESFAESPLSMADSRAVLRRLEAAEDLGWSMGVTEKRLSAVANWTSGEETQAAALTREVLLSGDAGADENTNSGSDSGDDFLVYSLGRAAAREANATDATLVAGRFARLALQHTGLANTASQLLKLSTATADIPGPDLLSFARLNLLSGDIDGAAKYLGAITDPAELLQMAKRELSMIDAANNHRLSELKSLLSKDASLPSNVADRLRYVAVDAALKHLRGIVVRTEAEQQQLMNQLALAGEMSVGETAATAGFEQQIEQISQQHVDSIRQSVLDRIATQAPDFGSIYQLCGIARIDEVDDPRLKYALAECEVQVGVALSQPLPVRPLGDNLDSTFPWRAYGEYVRSIASESLSLQKARQLAVSVDVDRANALGDGRLQRVSNLLAATALRQARPNAAAHSQQPPFAADRVADVTVLLGTADRFGQLNREQNVLFICSMWQSATNETLAATQTWNVLANGRDDFAYRDFLVNSLARHLPDSQHPQRDEFARVVAGPFARMALESDVDDRQFSRDFLIPATELMARVGASRARSVEDAVAFARLSVLTGNFDSAETFLGKAGNDPEAAKDRRILDQFQRFQLEELEASLNAESTMPKRVKTTYRRNAVRIAVQNVAAGNIGDSLQLVSVAKRLTRELDPTEAQAFNRQLDSAVEQQLQTFRQRLLEDGRLAAVDYDELLKRCRVAQIGQQQDAYSTGLKFLLTECELETKATKVTPPPESATNIHENYVRAIWEHRLGDRDDGFRLANDICKTSPTNYARLGAHRLSKVGAVLAARASEMSTIGEQLTTLEQIRQRPYGNRAVEAVRLFDTSRIVGYTPTRQETAHRAAALWDMRNDGTAANLTKQLLADAEQSLPHTPYLVNSLMQFVDTNVNDEELVSWSKVLAAPYAKLVSSLPQPAEASDRPVAFFNRYLVPGIRVCDVLDPQRQPPQDRAEISALYALGGDLIHDYSNADWGYEQREDLFKRQLELYDAALKFEDSANGHYGRGIASYSLGDLDAALQGAEAALDREPQMAKAHFLRARARTALARKLPMDERKAAFGDIVEVYTTALKQQENSKVLERLVLDGRAQTQLEFANYLSELSRVTKADESRSIRGYLEAARKDASAVLNSGPGKEHLSTFYQRLGNIEEDFAWLLDSDSKAQYEKAIANFDKALEAAETTTTKSESLYHRGRCYEKLARFLDRTMKSEANDNEQLLLEKERAVAHAESDLQAAIELNESEGKYWRWLGEARAHLGNESAIDAYNEAIRLGTTDVVPALKKRANEERRAEDWIASDRTFHTAFRLSGRDQVTASGVLENWKEGLDTGKGYMNVDRVLALRDVFDAVLPEALRALELDIKNSIATECAKLSKGLYFPANDTGEARMVDALKVLEVARRFATAPPIRAEVMATIGEAHVAGENWKEATTAFSAATRVYTIATAPQQNEMPRIADWHYNLGFALARSGSIPQARAAFMKADQLRKAGKKMTPKNDKGLNDILPKLN